MVAANSRSFSHLPPGTPVYLLLKDCFLEDDTLHAEGEEIAYRGCPNEWMEPLNDPARERMTAYLTMLEDAARAVAERNGRPFTGRITDIGEAIAQGHVDAKTQAHNIVMPARALNPSQRGDTRAVQAQRGRDVVLGAKAPPAPSKRGTTGPQEIIGVTSKDVPSSDMI